MEQFYLTAMSLATRDIERDMPHDVRLDGCAVERVVPADITSKGLRIGADFDQANMPGRHLPLLINTTHHEHFVKDRAERALHGILCTLQGHLFIGNAEAGIQIMHSLKLPRLRSVTSLYQQFN